MVPQGWGDGGGFVGAGLGQDVQAFGRYSEYRQADTKSRDLIARRTWGTLCFFVRSRGTLEPSAETRLR